MSRADTCRALLAGLLWVALAGSSSACGDGKTIPNTKVDFEGRVTDASTGDPIVGASVSTYVCDFLFCTNQVTTTTNAQGRYVIFSECYGNNGLGVIATGYEPTSRAVNCAQGRQVADFALTRTP